MNRRLKRIMREAGFQLELDALLEGKSNDYLAGFKDGYDLVADYMRGELEDFEKMLLELMDGDKNRGGRQSQ